MSGDSQRRLSCGHFPGYRITRGDNPGKPLWPGGRQEGKDNRTNAVQHEKVTEGVLKESPVESHATIDYPERVAH